MWLRGRCRNIRRNTLLNLAPLIRLIRAHSVSLTSTRTEKIYSVLIHLRDSLGDFLIC